MDKAFYEFGGFRLDATEHLLYRKGGRVVPLKPKVVETLELLIREQGRLISKDELMARLWPDTVVEESNLAQNVYLLRKVLGTDEQGRSFIETVPKRGYRFVAQVELFKEDFLEPVSALPPPTVVAVNAIASGAAAGAPLNSIAVLPLTNESADPGAEYLSDGITESVINLLVQLPQLKVIARSTVFRYKGRTVTPQKVGHELGVKAILTGRVLQLGDRIIVRTELVDAVEGWQLWGEQYDSLSADILELQQTIAQDVSENLQLKLTGGEQKRLTKRPTTSTEAYHLFIKARYYLNKRIIESIEKAVGYFQKAIDIDPTYAAAYVGLADCYPLLTLYGALSPRDAYSKAEAAAHRALEIDDSISEAHNALGVVKLFYDWDWEGAEQTFAHAIHLNPSYPDAHQRYGMLLVARGRFEESTAEFARAQELDPLSLITRTISGYPFYYARKFEQAAKRFQEVIDMDQNYSMAHFRLGLTYAQQGRHPEALAELRHSVKLSGDRDVVAALAYVFGRAGDSAGAAAAIAELDHLEESAFVSAYDRALIYAGLGDVSTSLDWLEKAYEERSYWLIYIQFDPALDPLRHSPRFAALLSKIAG
jgi:TolB-like protein/DNA-binding winged helix-turn-helix (wHTH) protein/Tfp pilus assembly protein PilF